MQRLEVSGAVRLMYRSLGVKGLNILTFDATESDLLTAQSNYKQKLLGLGSSRILCGVGW